jgi:putative aldouronate transport system permease protein
MIVDADMMGLAGDAKDVLKEQPTSDMVIATSMIVAIIPIVCVYPFIQKYFVKGVMIGSIKG